MCGRQGAGGDVELHLYDHVGHAYMNGFTAEAVQKMKDMQLPVGPPQPPRSTVNSCDNTPAFAAVCQHLCQCSPLCSISSNYVQPCGRLRHHSHNDHAADIGWCSLVQRPDNLQEVQEQSWSRLLAFFEKHLTA